MSEPEAGRWSEPSLAPEEPLRLAVAANGTPEWYLAGAIRRLASEAGITLEPKRFEGGEARRVASLHEGMAEVGIALADTARWAYRAEAAYEGWRQTSLRAIAAIEQTQWLGVAVRFETRVASLDELGAARGLRLLAPLPGGESTTWSFLASEVLDAHGADPTRLAAQGWRVEELHAAARRVRALDFDALVAPIGPFLGPQAHVWHEASALANLRFLPLPDATLSRLETMHGLQRGVLPAGYLRGVEQAVPTVQCDRWVVLVAERLADETAVALARALEDRRARLLRLHAGIDALRSLEDLGIPVHRAVLADQRARGLST